MKPSAQQTSAVTAVFDEEKVISFVPTGSVARVNYQNRFKKVFYEGGDSIAAGTKFGLKVAVGTIVTTVVVSMFVGSVLFIYYRLPVSWQDRVQTVWETVKEFK